MSASSARSAAWLIDAPPRPSRTLLEPRTGIRHGARWRRLSHHHRAHPEGALRPEEAQAQDARSGDEIIADMDLGLGRAVGSLSGGRIDARLPEPPASRVATDAGEDAAGHGHHAEEIAGEDLRPTTVQRVADAPAFGDALRDHE